MISTAQRQARPAISGKEPSRLCLNIIVFGLIGFVGAVCPSASAQNPVPFVSQPLLPATIATGGPQLALTVNGAGFVSTSVVNWNGRPLATTFISSNRLTATVPAANIATPGTASVTVITPVPGGVGPMTRAMLLRNTLLAAERQLGAR